MALPQEKTQAEDSSATGAKDGLLPERDFAGRQFIGTREKQEDYYAFSDVSTQKESKGSRLLVALGDGLGAHLGGNIASFTIVDEFVRAYKRGTLSEAWRMRVALEAANDKLNEITMRLAMNTAPMGSTFIGVSLTRQAMHWISVGDSCLYLLRAGKLLRLNADHSLAPILDERMRRGELTPEQAAAHPDRHILQSACMGLPLTIVDARMEPYPLKSGDVLVSASDGVLTLEHQQLEEMLAFGRTTTAGKIADAIIFAVRCANHPRQDNVTVAVVKIP